MKLSCAVKALRTLIFKWFNSHFKNCLQLRWVEWAKYDGLDV